MNRFLVTGGAGFIGSHLCERLISEGNYVICVDSLLTGLQSNIEHLEQNDNFTFINADVTEEFELSEDIDYLFHLASPASPNHSSPVSYHALPMETMMVNTTGTKKMLELARSKGARFVFSSTSEIYGDPLEHPQKEDYRGNVSTIGPRSVYDEAKRFGETLTAYFARENGVDARIARIFNTFGPRMRKEDKRMVVEFINEALAGDPIRVFGDGSQTRSIIYIDDMVDGLLRLMTTDGLKGEVINLGATEEYTVLEYAEMIKKLTNSQSEITFPEKLPEDDPLKRRPDITKAKSLLNWEPQVSMEEGLKKTIRYCHEKIGE